jgi:hypothetical protein
VLATGRVFALSHASVLNGRVFSHSSAEHRYASMNLYRFVEGDDTLRDVLRCSRSSGRR